MVAEYRVLVCGGRDYSGDVSALDELDPQPTLIIHGGASGADAAANEWARKRGIDREVYRARWMEFGRRAGPIRNAQMLDEGDPHLVVAFPGGRGTADMVRQAEARGVRVIRISESNNP